MNAKKSTAEQAIFDEIEAEIAELEEDFGDLGLDDDDGETSSSELDELDAALAGTEFGAETAESSDMGEISILQIADGAVPVGGDEEGILDSIGGFLKDKLTSPIKKIFKRRAKNLINRLLKLVRRAAKYRSCVPKVMLAVGAFKIGKYGTSLKLGWAAYRCIRSKS